MTRDRANERDSPPFECMMVESQVLISVVTACYFTVISLYSAGRREFFLV